MSLNLSDALVDFENKYPFVVEWSVDFHLRRSIGGMTTNDVGKAFTLFPHRTRHNMISNNSRWTLQSMALCYGMVDRLYARR